ncbi:SWIB/MDM2 domain-containing protein [Chlamydia suis]|uniref:SWIB/MDM2 domain-containing protein n=1 Tax=Chlamydia suis TaxID=83559 RepID=UPI0003BFFCF2|nr:SWIB/MDM2 domain-containing protein [Chlamydia suis]ESN89240.1 DNA topoisomerase III [Chlamydia suis MD56]MCI5641633.1 SWIB/MDM2 domain-containing protein [Chlamydia suis]MDD6309720.1 SWIB/MDM2 domain-containing protein [Chlamydia suis]MDD7385612.1 SWIB/MDM2 domain-containing protein [Chlamydia suis]MDY4960926.1 SWIB/MDM2 domain-containing protein [Chlamydia suis]
MSQNKNSAFMQPVNVSADLAAIVGTGPMPRTEIIKKIWDYIKKNNLQDPTNKRNINPDDKLAKVFGSKNAVDMFQMTKLVSKHIVK